MLGSKFGLLNQIFLKMHWLLMTGMTLFSQFSFFLKRNVELVSVLGCLGSIPAPQNSASMKEKLTRVSGGTVLITQCAGPNRLPIVELGIKIGGNQQILLHIIRSPNETSYRWQKCRQTSCYMQPIHLLRMLVFLTQKYMYNVHPYTGFTFAGFINYL